MNKQPVQLFLLILSLTVLPVSAQETKVVRDLGLWTGAELEKKVKKDWTFSLKQEVRLKTNMSEVNHFFTQAGVRYRINRNFALEAKYRYTRNRKNDGTYENRSRYSLDMRYRGRFDFVTIDYRLRYQKEVESMRLLARGEPYEKYVRNRLMFSYTDLKKITPYLYGESFQLFQLNMYPRFLYVRFETGVRYEPGEFGEFRLAWGFDREINVVDPATIFMMRVNYTYSF